MKLDTANRAFLGLAAAGVAAYGVAGIGACALLALVAYRVSVDGMGALTGGGAALGFALVFLVLVGAGAITGLGSLRSQLRATRRLIEAVHRRRLPVPPRVADAAAAAGASPRRIDLVEAQEPFSFAYGLLLPRIAVSSGLLEAAADAELRAVIEHERYHVRNLDPAKVLVARSLPPVFFYVPILRDLRRRYVAGRELAADRRAVERVGRGPLAGALFKVVGGPAWADLATAAALGGPELLQVRVTQLEEGREPAIPGVSRRAALLSAAGAALLVGSLVVALAGAGEAFVAMRRAMPSAFPLPLRAAGMTVCVGFWAWVGWRAVRWLRWRTRLGLDTTAAS